MNCEWCGQPGATRGFCSKRCEKLWLDEDRNAELRAEAADDAHMDNFGPDDWASDDYITTEVGGD